MQTGNANQCNHPVYLLFLTAQNAVNHIAVQFPVLIQLAELLGLGERGGCLLALNGNGDKPLVFGLDERDFHGGGERQLFLVHHRLELRHKLGQPDIPLYLLVVHAVALPHDFRGAFSNVPGGHALHLRPLMADGLHLHFQRLGLFHRQNLFPVAQVVVRHRKDGLIVRHVADDTRHICKPGQLTGPLAAVARDDFIAAALAGTHQRGLMYAVVLDRLHKPFHFRIVPHTERMVFEREQLRKFEIDNLFLFSAGRVTGLGRLFCCSSPLLGRKGVMKQ